MFLPTHPWISFHAFFPRDTTARRQPEVQYRQKPFPQCQNIICKTVSCCRCIQLKYRIRHIDPTVWQAKENVLRKIPCCMYGKRTPETVHIIYHEGKQNSDKKNIQDRKHRNSVIRQMQQRKQQCISDNCNHRIFITPAQFLI